MELANLKVIIGSDHGGFELKAQIVPYLKGLQVQITDYGVYSKDSMDYPDIAFLVAFSVARKEADYGIIIDGAGVGSAIVANKVPGIRAGACNDLTMARNSKEHNDCNILTLGSGIIGLNKAKQIVQTWLTTEYEGGRHQGRIDKIIQYERKFIDSQFLRDEK
ncbi:ribose 5-phosphate isomerase B [Candidatus Riflebacteria bacterium]